MTGVEKLIEAFTLLPGIGKKSASRISYFLLKNRTTAKEVSDIIREITEKITNCSICGNYTTADPCRFCSSDSRDDSIICVVEEPMDLLAIEETGNYKGRYHILMGSLNPLAGIGPEKLRISELVKRIEKGGFAEVLVATNPTTDGEATFLYISKALSSYGVRISRLATGIPMGGSLEYADKLTLSKAIQSKHYIKS